jgi:hypothetical protein
MKSRTVAVAAALAVAGLTASTAVEAGTLKVNVDLSRQHMSVQENGETIHTWPISSGRAGFRTITGTFKPQWMTRMHYSRKFDNSPMPNAIFFRGGFAIHGTYATGHLGSPASHGCVRLAPGNAKTLYNLVSKHGSSQTTISVFGSARDRAPAAVASKYKSRYKSAYADQPSSRTTSRKTRYTSSDADSGRPKIIYRNGQAYMYVGKDAARRYYAKKRYSGGYSNY